MRQSIVGALERETDLTVCGVAEDAQKQLKPLRPCNPISF